MKLNELKDGDRLTLRDKTKCIWFNNIAINDNDNFEPYCADLKHKNYNDYDIIKVERIQLSKNIPFHTSIAIYKEEVNENLIYQIIWEREEIINDYNPLEEIDKLIDMAKELIKMQKEIDKC